MKKIINKICIKCVEFNHPNISESLLKIPAEVGVCECCGEFGILVPMQRYFQTNQELKLHNEAKEEEPKKQNKSKKQKIVNQSEKSEEDIYG